MLLIESVLLDKWVYCSVYFYMYHNVSFCIIHLNKTIVNVLKKAFSHSNKIYKALQMEFSWYN